LDLEIGRYVERLRLWVVCFCLVGACFHQRVSQKVFLV
jgi:hypothetical protein